MALHLSQTEKQLCHPNPCKYNGTCIVTGETTFVCNCDGIGYTGKTCEILLINAPEFSTLAVNSPIEFFMSSYPDREFMLYLVPDDTESLEIKPSYMMFSQGQTHHNVSMIIKKPGKYTLEYKIKDRTLNYQPVPPATILVTNKTVNKSDYFDKHGVKPGILQPGCYESKILSQVKCPSGVSQLFLKSTCTWTNKTKSFYSAGIIFSSDNKFDMPISIAGAKFKLWKSKPNISPSSLSKDEFEIGNINCNNGSTENVFKSDSHCNSMPLSINDIQSILCHESLASTYFSQSSKLIPKWLKLNALPSNHTHDMHSYMVDLVYAKGLKSIGECSKIAAVTNGLYSVMLYSGSLQVELNKKSVEFPFNRSSLFCFAVNLCEGASSPLYIAIPSEGQNVLQSLEFMHDLKSKGWIITINSLVISNSQKSMISDMAKPIPYWNGEQFSIPSRQQPKMVTHVEFTKLFSNNDSLNAQWAFSGNVYLFHDTFNKVHCMHTYIHA